MKIQNAIIVALLSLSTAPCMTQESDEQEETFNYISSLQEEEAFRLGVEAYVYGFPLVLMDVTKEVSTNVPSRENVRAPINQFANLKEFPNADFKMIVSPNVDTLYSVAWLDLAKEPIVLHVPDTGDHYFLMQMLDGWTNVFCDPGTRTIGNKAHDFAICGPGWKGKLPAEVTEIKAPTNMVWIIGRTQCSGPQDSPAVHAIQNGYSLTPLRSFGKAYIPPSNIPIDPDLDSNTPPVEQVFKMDAATFFNRLAELMRSNPPAPEDTSLVGKLLRLKLILKEPFDYHTASPAVQRGLTRSIKAAQAKIIPHANKEELINGWHVMLKNIGNYGADYHLRATVAFFGLGANLPQDAVYPYTEVDSDGHPLNGSYRYILHFDKGQTPPVNAFWSVTMYGPEHFFVPNPVNRYAVKSTDPLVYNDDGSLDITIQHNAPENKTANWLPAPEGSFNLIMRLYWPKTQVLDGLWHPPSIQKISEP